MTRVTDAVAERPYRKREMTTKRDCTQNANATTKELIARARHDLRSPLTAIKGFASLVLFKQDRLSPAQQHQFIEAICQASDQVVRMVDSLEVLLKAAEGEPFAAPERVDLADLIEEVMKGWRTRDTSHEFNSAFAEGLPLAQCDPLRTRLALDSLIEYVVGYSQSEAPILVSVQFNTSKIAITVHAVDESAEGTEAPGLDTPRPHKWGISMSACEQIAEAQRGGLSVEAETVIFTLPTWEA